MVRIASANCGSVAGQRFTYDPFGNIDKTGSPYSFSPVYTNTRNRISTVGSTTAQYDNNGNVLNDGVNTYTWDADGNSITVDAVGATFDALDRMVEQNRSSVYTEIVYSPTGAKLALMSGTTGQTLQNAFINLPGQATAVYTSSGLDHYRHSDWLGSARLTSSPSQTVLSATAYAPFGETYATYPNPSASADPSFTGQNSDTVSGDYDFLAREYSTQGRWPSPDPAGQAAANPVNPQSWNRYAYVLNNPLGFTDPLGLWCQNPANGDETGDDYESCVNNGGNWIPICGVDTICVTATVYANPPANPSVDPQYDASLPTAPDMSWEGSAGQLGSGGGPQTPWYKNSCITGALKSGAISVGIDALGFLPEAGGVARVVGHQAGYVGKVADNLGKNMLTAGTKTTGVLSSATGFSSSDWTTWVSAGITAADFVPVLSDFTTPAAMIWDGGIAAYKAYQCPK